MSATGHRRAWGWHPLADEWAAHIVADAGVRPGELVLDIGAGEGALTRHLVDAGARVIAIELHPGRAEQLRWRFASSSVRVVQADGADLRLPRRSYRVVASPPYAISSALLGRLLAHGSRLSAADLVLQRAAARRFADGRAPGAGRWQRDWTIEMGRHLPRRAFCPAPKVDSSVLVVRRVRR